MGKAATIYAVNGTEILLPCTFSSCFGFYDLAFWWSYNSSDTHKIVSRGDGGGQDRPDPRRSAPASSQTLVPWELTPVRWCPELSVVALSLGVLCRASLERPTWEGCSEHVARIWGLLEFWLESSA